jgi:hypothetical protein
MPKRPGWHTGAYYASVPTGTATYTQLTAVQDGQITRSAANNLMLPADARIALAMAWGQDLTLARFNVPSLRDFGKPHIQPLNPGTTNPTVLNVMNPRDYSLRVLSGEEIGVEAVHSNAGSIATMAGVWFEFNRTQAAVGPAYRIRGTAAITNVVGGWASGQITLDETLPAGEYDIIGMTVQGTGLVMGRLIFPEGGFRPGVPAADAADDVRTELFSFGNFGSFGSFRNFSLPQLEVFARAAAAAQIVWLDVCPMSRG